MNICILLYENSLLRLGNACGDIVS